MPRNLIRIVFAVLAWAAGMAVVQAQTPFQAQSLAQAQPSAQGPKFALPEPFQASATRTGDGLAITWSIAPDAYLYREKFSIIAPETGALRAALPAGVSKDDPTFGLVEVYHDSVTATLPAAELARAGGADKLELSWQGCDEKLGVCYPPERRLLDLATLELTSPKTASIAALLATPVSAQLADTDETASEAAQAPAPAAKAVSSPAATQMTPAPGAENGAENGAGNGWMDGSLLAMLATFLGFGLLLTFTPCVLPMIPILSGMLLRSGKEIAPTRAFVLSTTYVLAMAAAYALLGVVAAWSGQNLQLALQTPWALGAMSLLFIALALSMFGLFDLQLPAALTNRITGRTSGLGGSLSGAAALGFTSALIVGPCVTPPLAGALLYVSQTGDAARGAAALFALGLGMGLPLIAWGTFGPRALPRSGPWMVRVKQAFGVVFLAIAIGMLARVIPPQVSMTLWALLAIGAGVFLGALGPAREGAASQLARTAGVAALIYGATLLIGAAGGAEDPLRPLGFLAGSPAAIAAEQAGAASSATPVTTPAALDAAIAAARTAGKPIVIDFTADWCTVCKEIDRTVFAAADVRSRMGATSFIRVDLTDYTDASRALMQRYGVVGPPTILFFDPRTGNELPALRSIGALDASDFLRRLDLAGA